MTATDHMHKAVVVQAVSLAVIFLVSLSSYCWSLFAWNWK